MYLINQAFLEPWPELPRRHSGREFAFQCRRCKRHWFNSWVKKILWRRKWQPTLVFLPGKFHGQRSLVHCSSWGHKELDMTECVLTCLHTHTHTHTLSPSTSPTSSTPTQSHNQPSPTTYIIIHCWNQWGKG